MLWFLGSSSAHCDADILGTVLPDWMQELAELRGARCSEHAHRLWVSLWFLDQNAFRESVRNRWTFIDGDATTWMTINCSTYMAGHDWWSRACICSRSHASAKPSRDSCACLSKHPRRMLCVGDGPAAPWVIGTKDLFAKVCTTCSGCGHATWDDGSATSWSWKWWPHCSTSQSSW